MRCLRPAPRVSDWIAEKERAMFRALTRALFSTILVGYAAVAAAQEEPNRPAVRLSYIPGNFALPVLVAIERQSISGVRSRKAAGTFFAASPMISRLRTKARQSVSSSRKSLRWSP